MDNNATRDGSLLARFFLAVCAAPTLWRRSRRAALAAGTTYENARSAGAPHGVAAEAAFKILTKEKRPELPEVVAEAQSTRVEAADNPGSGVVKPGWPASQPLS